MWYSRAMDDDKKLERLDPESETCFKTLVETIAEELGARVAFGDDPRTPEGRRALSGLIADRVLDRFIVRERTSPRYRWVTRS